MILIHLSLLSVLFDLARELNKAKDNNPERAVVLASSLKYLGGLLGILQDDPEEYLKGHIHETKGALVGSVALVSASVEVTRDDLGLNNKSKHVWTPKKPKTGLLPIKSVMN